MLDIQDSGEVLGRKYHGGVVLDRQDPGESSLTENILAPGAIVLDRQDSEGIVLDRKDSGESC